ncbi:hypothetical protein CcNV_049 [Crangon crangon nudivirus]|uniref:IBR domain-containing protein n=1 Tax=Crangon crangon nudivirus TaxID=2880838 RepID=A0AAE8Y0Y4_9VIRU|nr:hypothetical protein QKT25_gp049 [Crangon crangon nudivirus]UBZ25533.1 hypothetical protein CcNV_049 [Crangon crangon nudivirus]
MMCETEDIQGYLIGGKFLPIPSSDALRDLGRSECNKAEPIKKKIRLHIDNVRYYETYNRKDAFAVGHLRSYFTEHQPIPYNLNLSNDNKGNDKKFPVTHIFICYDRTNPEEMIRPMEDLFNTLHFLQHICPIRVHMLLYCDLHFHKDASIDWLRGIVNQCRRTYGEDNELGTANMAIKLARKFAGLMANDDKEVDGQNVIILNFPNKEQYLAEELAEHRSCTNTEGPMVCRAMQMQRALGLPIVDEVIYGNTFILTLMVNKDLKTFPTKGTASNVVVRISNASHMLQTVEYYLYKVLLRQPYSYAQKVAITMADRSHIESCSEAEREFLDQYVSLPQVATSNYNGTHRFCNEPGDCFKQIEYMLMRRDVRVLTRLIAKLDTCSDHMHQQTTLHYQPLWELIYYALHTSGRTSARIIEMVNISMGMAWLHRMTYKHLCNEAMLCNPCNRNQSLAECRPNVKYVYSQAKLPPLTLIFLDYEDGTQRLNEFIQTLVVSKVKPSEEYMYRTLSLPLQDDQVTTIVNLYNHSPTYPVGSRDAELLKLALKVNGPPLFKQLAIDDSAILFYREYNNLRIYPMYKYISDDEIPITESVTYDRHGFKYIPTVACKESIVNLHQYEEHLRYKVLGHILNAQTVKIASLLRTRIPKPQPLLNACIRNTERYIQPCKLCLGYSELAEDVDIMDTPDLLCGHCDNNSPSYGGDSLHTRYIIFDSNGYGVPKDVQPYATYCSIHQRVATSTEFSECLLCDESLIEWMDDEAYDVPTITTLGSILTFEQFRMIIQATFCPTVNLMATHKVQSIKLLRYLFEYIIKPNRDAVTTIVDCLFQNPMLLCVTEPYAPPEDAVLCGNSNVYIPNYIVRCLQNRFYSTTDTDLTLHLQQIKIECNICETTENLHPSQMCDHCDVRYCVPCYIKIIEGKLLESISLKKYIPWDEWSKLRCTKCFRFTKWKADTNYHGVINYKYVMKAIDEDPVLGDILIDVCSSYLASTEVYKWCTKCRRSIHEPPRDVSCQEQIAEEEEEAAAAAAAAADDMCPEMELYRCIRCKPYKRVKLLGEEVAKFLRFEPIDVDVLYAQNPDGVILENITKTFMGEHAVTGTNQLVPIETFREYYNTTLTRQEFIRKIPELQVCPNEGCAVIISKMSNCCNVECTNCETVFCWLCSKSNCGIEHTMGHLDTCLYPIEGTIKITALYEYPRV